MRVQDLTPGDVCQNLQYADGDEKGWGTFIAKDWHPVFSGLMLVVWHLAWEQGDDRWSFDALSPHQELDHMSPVVPLTPEQRKANMRRVLGLK